MKMEEVQKKEQGVIEQGKEVTVEQVKDLNYDENERSTKRKKPRVASKEVAQFTDREDDLSVDAKRKAEKRAGKAAKKVANFTDSEDDLSVEDMRAKKRSRMATKEVAQFADSEDDLSVDVKRKAKKRSGMAAKKVANFRDSEDDLSVEDTRAKKRPGMATKKMGNFTDSEDDLEFRSADATMNQYRTTKKPRKNSVTADDIYEHQTNRGRFKSLDTIRDLSRATERSGVASVYEHQTNRGRFKSLDAISDLTRATERSGVASERPRATKKRTKKVKKSEPMKVLLKLLTTAIILAVLVLVVSTVVVLLEIYELKPGTALLEQMLPDSEKINNSIIQFTQDQRMVQSVTRQLIDAVAGQYHSFPVSSCDNLSSSIYPSGYYWVASSGGSATRVFCDMTNYPVSSCAALSTVLPSGYYSVGSRDGNASRVYCDMTRTCGGVTGGWMRIAQLNMTDPTEQCPEGLKQSYDQQVRTCRTKSRETSDVYSVHGTKYTRVCGRITAYQFGGPYAYHRSTSYYTANLNISDYIYVDGVSITHGNPKQHIWSFAIAFNEGSNSDGRLGIRCSCIHPSIDRTAPEFVGNDYFCDTGVENEPENKLYVDDPVWDGAGCGPQSTCCTFNNPPWFYKELLEPTTDYIELRVLCFNCPQTADIALEQIELYVQ